MALHNLANLRKQGKLFTEAGSGSMEDDIASENTTSSVSSQKSGAKKTDHSDKFRLEALSFQEDQRSQTTLPRNIEKIPSSEGF